MTHIVPVRADDPRLPALADAMADAFHDDPGYNNLYPDPDLRDRAGAFIHLRMARIHAPLGGTFVAEDGGVQGGTFWSPPGTHVGKRDYLRHGLIRLVPMLGPGLLVRTLRFDAEMTALCAPHRRAPHWYLKTLGVRRDGQGRGIGGALIRKGLTEFVDAAGLPCVLTTANEANLAYYENFGFVTVGEALVGEPGGLPMWCMKRPAIPR